MRKLWGVSSLKLHMYPLFISEGFISPAYLATFRFIEYWNIHFSISNRYDFHYELLLIAAGISNRIDVQWGLFISIHPALFVALFMSIVL